MKIIVTDGQVKKFTDSGDVTEQLKNIEALVVYLQHHAENMEKVSGKALGDRS